MEILAHGPVACLRRLERGDLGPFQAYRNDPDVARFQSWSKMTDDEALGFLIAMETEPLLSPNEWCQIAVSRPETQELVGDMGLFLSLDRTEAEVGISLAPHAQGRGIASAAMALAFGLIWRSSTVQAIRAWGDQRNTASVALMRRVGMTHIGTETGEITEEAFILHRPANL